MLEALTPWWPDFASFLRMGRHGFYVWSAVGICALALALEWWALRRRRRALRQKD
jgi:heme exporter protein CcmD